MDKKPNQRFDSRVIVPEPKPNTIVVKFYGLAVLIPAAKPGAPLFRNTGYTWEQVRYLRLLQELMGRGRPRPQISEADEATS